jgi:uncharacterized DUF497 family protein
LKKVQEKLRLHFEWDRKKAVSNWQKHGVSSEEVMGAFRDPFALEIIDDPMDYGEERINLIVNWTFS